MRAFIASLVGFLAINSAMAASSTSEYATGKVGRSAMLSAKHGTVVDAATGAGIADATVIAAWHIHSTGWERDSGGCVVRRIVQTDAAGNFDLPDVSAEQWFHTPHASMTERVHALAGTTDFAWYLAVFKPGYLREGDAETLARYTTMNPTFFDWAWKSPRTYSTRDGYRVAPIKLQKTALSPPDEIAYLWKVMDFARDCENTNPPPPPSPDYEALLRQIEAIVQPLPCSLPDSAKVSGETAMDFSQFIRNRAFFDRMKKEGETKWPWVATTAGALCRASRDMEKGP